MSLHYLEQVIVALHERSQGTRSADAEAVVGGLAQNFGGHVPDFPDEAWNSRLHGHFR